MTAPDDLADNDPQVLSFIEDNILYGIASSSNCVVAFRWQLGSDFYDSRLELVWSV